MSLIKMSSIKITILGLALFGVVGCASTPPAAPEAPATPVAAPILPATTDYVCDDGKRLAVRYTSGATEAEVAVLGGETYRLQAKPVNEGFSYWASEGAVRLFGKGKEASFGMGRGLDAKCQDITGVK
jgi:Membrane-bound lysozyme-inhibitor of c-type lysozyme